MSMRSPAVAAIRLVCRRPSLLLAELAWRWSFAAAAGVLVALAAAEYLRSLPLRRLDRVLLRTRHPLLIARALLDVFHGSGPKLAVAIIITAVALLILWIALASIGRATTLLTLLPRPAKWNWRSLLGLNFFRVAVALTVGVAGFGSLMMAAVVSPLESVAPGVSFQVAFGLLTLVAIAFLQLNWLLSIAPVFVVRDAEDTFGSISAALNFVQEYLPEVLIISGIFGAMHVALLLFFASLALPLLGAASSLPGPLLMLLIFLLGLTYLGVAAGLYLARLAAYIEIAGAAPQALVLGRGFVPAAP